ncbi:MAG: lasso peptide biosynthesis B2 protein [Burkholderiales bacterium]
MHAAALLVYARIVLPSVDFRVDPDAVVPGASAAASQAAVARARAVARLVGIAAAHVPVRVTCLHRSVVLWWLLRRDGIRCELRLGARAGAGPFAAHAWVEYEGAALGEPPGRLVRYGAFPVPLRPRRLASRAWLARRAHVNLRPQPTGRSSPAQ